MEPINYSRDVLSPIEGFLSGIKFGEGVLGDRQARDVNATNMRATEQNTRIQQQEMDMLVADRAAAAQAAAQQQQAAQAGQQALMDYYERLEAGVATPQELRRAVIAFPGMAEQFTAITQEIGGERAGAEMNFGKQLAFALGQGNTDAARRLIETRKTAAENSGDQAAAAAYSAQLMELDQDPNGLLLTALMPLAATMEPGEFDTFYGIAVGEGEEPPAAQSQIAKLQADLDAGLINQDQYDLEVAKMAPSGMRIVSDGRGGFTMEQGAAVTQNDGRMSPSDPASMIRSIDETLNDPALESATGLLSFTQNIPGTDAYRFGTRSRQLEGQAFLQAFESLKGAGQITEIEGIKATQAIGRLDTAQRAEDYRDALNDLREVLVAAQERAAAANEPTAAAATPEAPARTRLRYNPETGTFE